MSLFNDVLEANLARLMSRAYRPVVPSDIFRRRLELAVRERAALVGNRAASGPWRRGRWLPVAAVASLLALFFSSTWWFSRGPGASPSAEAIVAAGDVAVRRTLDGRWTALGGDEAARGIEFDGPFLEVVTPAAQLAPYAAEVASASLEVRAAPHSRTRLEAASAARFWRADGGSATTGDWIAELRSGGLDLTRAAADPGGELRTAHGRVRLEEGELVATLVDRAAVPSDVLARLAAPGLAPAGSSARSEQPGTFLRLRLRAGAAALLGAPPESRALPVGEVVWVHGGRPVAEAEEPRRPDSVTRRQAAGPAGPEEPADDTESTSKNAVPTSAALVVHVATSEPVEGDLLVTLLREVQLPDVAFPEPHALQADASGRVVLPDLDPGNYAVFVHAEGLAPQRFDDVQLVAGETLRLDAELERGVTVRGRVVSAVTGEPLAGAHVLNEFDAAVQVLPFADVQAEYGPQLVRVATTDSQGRFELPRAGSRLLLRATAPGHGAAWAEPRAASGEVVEGVELALASSGGVVGVVLQSDGSPWSGAELVVAAADMMGRRPCMSFASAQTDSDGRFEVAGLPGGPHAVVLIGAPSGANPLPNVVIVDVVPGATTRITLPGGAEQASIFGRLLDARGASVAHLSVSLERLDAESGTTGWRGTRSDAGGQYELKGLEPGRYRLGVSQDMGGDIVTLQEFALRAGEERLLDLVLPPNELTGRVVYADRDEPVHAVAIILQRTGQDEEDGFAGKVLTERDGSFVFGHVPPGRYVVSAYPSDPELAARLVGEVAVVPGVACEPLSIALDPGGKIRVEVVDSSGAAVENAHVEVWDLHERPYYVSWRPRTDAEGALLAPSLPAGDFEVRVTHPAYRDTRVVTRVLVGETRTARIELTRSP